MKCYAVIGSNSFFGNALVERLNDTGAVAHRVQRPRCDLNINLPGIMSALHVHQPECIVNFAALSMVAQSWDDPVQWAQTNFIAQMRLTDWLRKQTWLKRYVQISTPEVYGSTNADLGGIPESKVYHPSTPYATTRAACDMWLQNLHDAYGFPVVWVRAANIYGAGQQLYRLIPKLIVTILKGEKFTLDGGGTSRRSFIHVRDAVRAVHQVAEFGSVGEVFHVSASNYYSIATVAGLVCREMGVIGDYHIITGMERLGKDADYKLDDSKIRKGLGWHDEVALEVGIAEVVAWCKANYEAFKDQPLDYIYRP